MKGQDIINLIEEHYLANTELSHVLFVEPDAVRLIFETTGTFYKGAKSYVGIDIPIKPSPAQVIGEVRG